MRRTGSLHWNLSLLHESDQQAHVAIRWAILVVNLHCHESNRTEISDRTNGGDAYQALRTHNEAKKHCHRNTTSDIEIIIKILPPLILHTNTSAHHPHPRAPATYYNRALLPRRLPLRLLHLQHASAPALSHPGTATTRTCSSSSISCASDTRPRSCPPCAMRSRIPSICRERSGLTSAMRDTAPVHQTNIAAAHKPDQPSIPISARTVEGQQKTSTYAVRARRRRAPSRGGPAASAPPARASPRPPRRPPAPGRARLAGAG